MRAGTATRAGRGVAIAGVGSARAAAAAERVVDAVRDLFGGGDTVDFTPVDGVYRPESEPDAARSQQIVEARRVRRVAASGRAAPGRFYDARAHEFFVEAPQLGRRIDVYA